MYTKEKEAAVDDRVLAGEKDIKIESFGSLKVDVDTPTGSKVITLLNVAYIPKFLTSIASMSLFEAKGVHFDTQVPHLHQNGETVFRIYKLGGHYTFKQYGQQSKPTHQVFATPKRLGQQSNGIESWLTHLQMQSCSWKNPLMVQSLVMLLLRKFLRLMNVRRVH